MSIIKKLGWDKLKGGFLFFLFNQKLVHVLVVLMTIIIVFTNFTTKTKAGAISAKSNKPIIAGLIGSEFGETEEEELIEEFLNEETLIVNKNTKYQEQSLALKSQPQINTNETLPEEKFITETSTENREININISSTEQKREEIIKYIVESGDTISVIAARFGISVNTILWENNLNSHSVIRPNDILKILPVTGISHEVSRGETLGYIAQKYDADEDKIKETNNLADAGKIQIGQRLIIPDGEKTTYVAKTTINTYSGLSVIKDLVKPSNAIPVSNKMNWPTVGHVISQYYSWRHKGLDIANSTGTPLYAADAGTVEYSGWSTGYGYNVLINHGGGKKTRYAHASQLYVKKGDVVTKGETIAAMGSTGWSTGPHIHFEVIINNVKYNPLNYIR